jgi:molecular chaperone HtpG
VDILIPERLDALLGQSELGHAVRLSLRDFEPWIEGSLGSLFFFPEYTDHGPSHISAVLAAAEFLIRSDAWKHLTSEDAAVLVLATLLHDSAMHLAADGFLDLIRSQGKSDRQLIRPLDEKTWPQLFDQFYLEARRWDQRMLHNLLGDQAKGIEEEEDLATYIRHPREKPDPEDWSPRYRKFLGEFVRRHHARLAHEIALGGVPGASSDRLRLTRIPGDIADLAGLVARSHNMHLRDTFSYLKERYYGRVNCSNSHPVFLMVLLRIADYLEIRADRVSPARLRIQRLRSPISQQEWNAHLAVHEVRPDEEDREAVFVIAKPPTAPTFLKIRRLLSGLQGELDTSWAVLGEVFSKQGDLADLGLTLRRVRSNLDNLEQFIASERPPYVPIRAAFDTAGVDLLKLLIRPLYGDRPEVGVRELLQNALDAVHELRQWATEKGDPEIKSVPRPDQEADVLISIDREGRKGYWLTISDKGIGMTAETVRDYFLKAGASYRQSEAWRGHFEVEGKSKILRSGRFGIGALAAFLLGNRIEVATRHAIVPEHEGIRFSATIEDEVIELRREARNHVGTTIRVKLSPQAAKALSNYRNRASGSDWTNVGSLRQRHPWDWYVLEDPKVERYIQGELLEQQYHLPGPDPRKLPSDWRPVDVAGYQGVQWTYSKAPDLVCNGIRVESYRQEAQRKAQQNKLLGASFAFVNRPSVSVFDRDGRLPLNLQRTEIETGALPFAADLAKDVLADLYAFLLVHGPKDRESAERWIRSRLLPFEQLDYGAMYIERFWVTQEGMSMTHAWHVKKSALRQGILALRDRYHGADLSSRLTPPEVGIFFGTDDYHRTPEKVLHALKDMGVVGCRVFVTERGTQSFRPSRDPAARVKTLDKNLSLEEFGQVEDTAHNLLTPSLRKKVRSSLTLIELHFDPSHARVSESPLLDFFDSSVDTPIIPFDPEERRRKLPRLFDKLRDYIEVWRSGDLRGWRKKLVEKIPSDEEGSDAGGRRR